LINQVIWPTNTTCLLPITRIQEVVTICNSLSSFHLLSSSTNTLTSLACQAKNSEVKLLQPSRHQETDPLLAGRPTEGIGTPRTPSLHPHRGGGAAAEEEAACDWWRLHAGVLRR
jgi:hypothetical protein